MREDIEIPQTEKVFIAAVLEYDKEFHSENWTVHLINEREDDIAGVLVLSRGKSEDQKTSTLRHGLGDIKSKSSTKVEIITSEVFGFTNEYLVTFFANNKLYEGSFTFEPNSISKQNCLKLPIMAIDGVIAKF